MSVEGGHRFHDIFSEAAKELERIMMKKRLEYTAHSQEVDKQRKEDLEILEDVLVHFINEQIAKRSIRTERDIDDLCLDIDQLKTTLGHKYQEINRRVLHGDSGVAFAKREWDEFLAEAGVLREKTKKKLQAALRDHQEAAKVLPITAYEQKIQRLEEINHMQGGHLVERGQEITRLSQEAEGLRERLKESESDIELLRDDIKRLAGKASESDQHAEAAKAARTELGRANSDVQSLKATIERLKKSSAKREEYPEVESAAIGELKRENARLKAKADRLSNENKLLIEGDSRELSRLRSQSLADQGELTRLRARIQELEGRPDTEPKSEDAAAAPAEFFSEKKVLEEEIAQLKELLETAKELETVHDTDAAIQRQTIDTLQQTIHEQEANLAGKDEQLTNAAVEKEAAEQRVRALEIERSGHDGQINNLIHRLAEAEGKLQRLQKMQEERDAAIAESAQARSALDVQNAFAERLKDENQSLARDLQSERAKLADAERFRLEQEKQIDADKRRVVELGEQIATLEARVREGAENKQELDEAGFFKKILDERKALCEAEIKRVSVLLENISSVSQEYLGRIEQIEEARDTYMQVLRQDRITAHLGKLTGVEIEARNKEIQQAEASINERIDSFRQDHDALEEVQQQMSKIHKALADYLFGIQRLRKEPVVSAVKDLIAWEDQLKGLEGYLKEIQTKKPVAELTRPVLSSGVLPSAETPAPEEGKKIELPFPTSEMPQAEKENLLEAVQSFEDMRGQDVEDLDISLSWMSTEKDTEKRIYQETKYQELMRELSDGTFIPKLKLAIVILGAMRSEDGFRARIPKNVNASLTARNVRIAKDWKQAAEIGSSVYMKADILGQVDPKSRLIDKVHKGSQWGKAVQLTPLGQRASEIWAKELIKNGVLAREQLEGLYKNTLRSDKESSEKHKGDKGKK